jgi:hypothetical protein
MVDFDRFNEELDRAGCDLVNIHKIYERARAQIQAAPPDQQIQLETRLLELCQKRAERGVLSFDLPFVSVSFAPVRSMRGFLMRTDVGKLAQECKQS